MIPSLGYQLRALVRALAVGLNSLVSKTRARHRCPKDGHHLRLVTDSNQGFEYCDTFGCHFWKWADES